MSAIKRKKCKKAICFGLDRINEIESELKCKKVIEMPNCATPSTSKIKILENVQICPPSANFSSESDSDLEIFDHRKRKRNVGYASEPRNNNIYVSPCTGKEFCVLQNSNIIAETPSESDPSTLLRKNTLPSPTTPSRRFKNSNIRNHSGVSSPETYTFKPIALTPTQMLLRKKTQNLSGLSSPDSLNALCTSSRCSSLNNISCSNLLPLELNESSMQMLIKTTINTSKTSELTVSPYEDKNVDVNKKISKTNLNNDKQVTKQKINQEIETENYEQAQLNKYQDIQEEVDRDPQREEHQEIQTEDTNESESEESVPSDSDSNESLTENSDISEDSDTSQHMSEDEDRVPEDDDGWVDITDADVVNFDESTENSVTKFPVCNKLPIEIYSLFVTDDIIIRIVEETNKFAEKYLSEREEGITDKSRAKAWKPTDEEEMRIFFGVIFVMGLNRVPHLHDYWSKKSIYRNEFICSVMARDRFILLLKFWHFSSDTGENTGDKLYKIRQIFNMLNKRFQEGIRPGKFIVIDESMIPWRGRLQFRQYIKNKSHKYGVKIYKLCTPDRYTFNTIIYTGKEGNNREQNHGKNTVLKLINGLENEGRVLVANNFYSSVDLAEELIAKKTFYCGTLRSNRKGLPNRFVSKKIKKGQVAGKMTPSGVKVIKWCDKRQVLIITTCKSHNATLVDTGKKTRKTNEMIRKPSCILMYNDIKKGVDYSDQMASYYTTLRRGLKWYRKVMMEFLFGTAFINAWIIYNKSDMNKKMSKKDFTESIIEGLTGQKITKTEFPGGRCSDHVLKRGDKKRRCVGCYNKLRLTMNSTQAAKKTKRIITHCVQCKQTLCLPCFNEKHFP